MVSLWYLYGIFMVFIWYLYGIYMVFTSEGKRKSSEVQTK